MDCKCQDQRQRRRFVKEKWSPEWVTRWGMAFEEERLRGRCSRQGGTWWAVTGCIYRVGGPGALTRLGSEELDRTDVSCNRETEQRRTGTYITEQEKRNLCFNCLSRPLDMSKAILTGRVISQIHYSTRKLIANATGKPQTAGASHDRGYFLFLLHACVIHPGMQADRGPPASELGHLKHRACKLC